MAKLPAWSLNMLRRAPFSSVRAVFAADDLLTDYSNGLFDKADTTKSLDERPDMLVCNGCQRCKSVHIIVNAHRPPTSRTVTLRLAKPHRSTWP
jgi:hypothetical protein